MGLDMYLFRFKKPRAKKETIEKMQAPEIAKKYFLIDAEEMDDMPDGFEDLLPEMLKITADTPVFDIEKLKADRGIPAEAEMFGRWCTTDKMTLTFSAEGMDDIDVVVSTDEVAEKYTRLEKIDYWCSECAEVAYWRKCYDIEDAIYEACPKRIENCGYYPMTDEMWDVVRRLDPEQYRTARRYRDGKGIVAYHEWY